MRPCALIVPDLEHIVSVTLQSYGFVEHKLWSRKLVLLFKIMESQVSRHVAIITFVEEKTMFIHKKYFDKRFIIKRKCIGNFVF